MAARKTRAPKKRGKQKRKNSGGSTPVPALADDLMTRGPGQPRKLVETADLLMRIRNMAMAQCNQREAAAFLGVSPNTFREYLSQNPRSKDAWENGPDAGKAALRRAQLNSAMRGNVQMQKWLGTNWLGQRLKIDGRFAGPSGGPIKTINHNVNSEGPALKGKALADMYAATLNGGP
jgi:hypothetical protein